MKRKNPASLTLWLRILSGVSMRPQPARSAAAAARTHPRQQRPQQALNHTQGFSGGHGAS